MPGEEPARRPKRRWPWTLTAAVLLLPSAGAWWHVFGPLSAEERALVGEWEGRYDDRPSQPFAVMVYRPDRTFVCRLPDPRTGALTRESPPARWRLSGGRLAKRFGGAAGLFDDLVRRRHFYRAQVLDLTPDGPNRYRYAAVGPDGPNPLVTGTLTRLAPAPEMPS